MSPPQRFVSGYPRPGTRVSRAVVQQQSVRPRVSASLAVDDDTPDAGVEVTFTITVSPSTATWSLDFGDSTTAATGTGSGTTTHTYAAAATRTATLTVTSGGAVATDSVTITVASAFDPLVNITWHTAFKAGATCLKTGGTAASNGEEVVTWNDSSGNSRHATATTGPTYVAASAKLNNQPACDFDGDNDFIKTAAFTAITGTYSLVYIGSVDALTQFANLVCLAPTTSANPYLGTSMRTTSSVGLYDGNGAATTTLSDTNAHLIVAIGSGTATTKSVAIDGGTPGTASVGSSDPVNVSIGDFADGGATNGNLTVAFVGLYEGDITAHASYADLKTWITATYGITLS